MTTTALDRLAPPPCAVLLGWKLLDAQTEAGTVRIGFEGKPEFSNPAGFVQGGILTAMLDDTMGPAVFIKTDGRFYPSTISLTVNFLAPAEVGSIVAEARVVQLGKAVAFMEGRLVNAAGTVLATATANARLVDAEKVIR